MAGSREVETGIIKRDVPAIHTRYLAFPIPSAGIEVEFNPPTLRWPVSKGSGMTYDVRLSMDSTFRGKVIIKTGLTWAMFNAHEKLQDGVWYWSYKPAGLDWSPTQRFRVTAGAFDLVSPTPSTFLTRIPEEHPRVLADRSETEDLRRSVHDADAKAILAEAEAAMHGRVPTEADAVPRRETQHEERNRKFRQDASKRLGDFVYNTVIPLCQAYVLTGDDRYRQRAIAIVMQVARWDPRGVTGSDISDFSDARCMLAMAIAFDTFYDALSYPQRDLLIKAVHSRADGFFQSWINNQEARLLSGHVWQHILHYFFQTALAVHGDDPAAEDWLAYAYELFLARAPILGDTDGGWTEGVSYFRMNMETLLEIPLLIRKYTGFDFIRTHPWYTRNIDWLIYHIPPGSSADGFGDNTEEVFSPGADYIAYARELAKLTGSKAAAWYAQQCEQYENPDIASTRNMRWIRFARTRGIPIPTADQPLLPSGKLFGGTGLVSMHSDPLNTRSNLVVAMRSSPFGCYGHFLSDQNAFNIIYGGKRTFFRTGYKVTMKDPHRTGWYQHTKSNNSILINGNGQPYSTEAFGWIPAFVHGRDVAYAMADASQAYRSDETNEDYGVSKFFRHVLLLKPDIVVIYDELESHEAVKWSWLIHSMEEIRINEMENSFASRFDHARGIGKLWSSHPVTWTLKDTFDVPAVNWRASKNAAGKLKTYDDRQWHLTAASAMKHPAMRFLTILRISPEAKEETITAKDEDASLQLETGEWTISANMDPGSKAFLSVANDSGTSLIYRADETPVLVEMLDGKQKTHKSTVQVPWHYQQSWLWHTQHRNSFSYE